MARIGVIALIVATSQRTSAQEDEATLDQPSSESSTDVSATEEDAPAGDDAPTDDLSADDLAAIEAASGADRAEAEEVAVEQAAPAASGGSADQSMNPDISFIADVAYASFSEDGSLQTGGHDPSEAGFVLQQLEMAVGAPVDPYFRLDGNIVFGLFGVEIEEVYATALPGDLKIKAGQFLTAIGRINATHLHSWDFVDQPFSIGRIFGGEGNRGLGLELAWLSPMPWYVELVGSATNATGEGTARSFYGAEQAEIEGVADLEYVIAVKQFFPLSDDWSLSWGNGVALGPNATGPGNRTEVYGTDLYLKWRPISSAEEASGYVALQTEWFYRRRQIPSEVLSDLNGYAQLSWRFAERWGLAARYEVGTPAETETGQAGLDDLDPDWTLRRDRVSASATFWPTEFSRIRLQGAMDSAKWLPEPRLAGFIAVEFLVGAHGAHQF